MTPPRMTIAHIGRTEEAQSRTERLIRTVEAAIADGRIEAFERTAIAGDAAAALEPFPRLIAEDGQIDNVFRVMGVLCRTVSFAGWTGRVADEAAADEARLEAAGLLVFPASDPKEAA